MIWTMRGRVVRVTPHTLRKWCLHLRGDDGYLYYVFGLGVRLYEYQPGDDVEVSSHEQPHGQYVTVSAVTHLPTK